MNISMKRRWRSRMTCACLLALCASIGCRLSGSTAPPAIEFTTVPEAADGGSERLAPIAGRVTGARAGQQIVLFAKSGMWWVQPYTVRPFTTIDENATWSNTIHLGTEYAALLVEPGYRPAATLDVLPKPGAGVLAVASITGTGGDGGRPQWMTRADHWSNAEHTIAFSGYEWQVRQTPSDRGGANDYDATNAWTDARGFLHLKLAQRDGRWFSAEVKLTRALGYGTYLFVVGDTSHLDPSAALSLVTWDDQGADQNHRELDVEISQWGDPSTRNAQYVIQPYYVAANVARFAAPPGRLTHSWRWEPGRAAFQTTAGPGTTTGQRVVARHEFASGVPTPGDESVHINLYYFRYAPRPPQRDVEVVIEKFQYLP